MQTQHAEIIKEGKLNEVIEILSIKNGLEYQLIQMLERLNQGEIESDVHPLSTTIKIMELMDLLRAEWRVLFMSEKKGL